jgi:hypothetical protein
MTGGEGCCLGYHMHRAAYTICALLCTHPSFVGKIRRIV